MHNFKTKKFANFYLTLTNNNVLLNLKTFCDRIYKNPFGGDSDDLFCRR